MNLIYRILKRIIQSIVLMISVLLLIPVCGAVYIFSGLFTCSNLVYTMPSSLPIAQEEPGQQKAQQLKTPLKDYHRPESYSFLSFPEWYPVYTAQAYGQHVAKNLPSHFPYFGVIKQFWQSYCHVHAFTQQQKYPSTFKQDAIILTIGTGFTAQYLMKGLYENTFGRLSEWSSADHLVPEDQFAAKVANEYAAFGPTLQSTHFSFIQQIKKLWQETPLWGDYPIRRWERKFVLTAEYTLRGIYNGLLGLGVQAHLKDTANDTKVWANEITPAALALPGITSLAQINPQSYLLSLPRYQKFTTLSLRLFEQSARFQDVAGNHLIMLSAIVPIHRAINMHNASIIFTQPLLTQPQLQRIGIVVPVSTLPETVKGLSQNGQIEHIYDY